MSHPTQTAAVARPRRSTAKTLPSTPTPVVAPQTLPAKLPEPPPSTPTPAAAQTGGVEPRGEQLELALGGEPLTKYDCPKVLAGVPDFSVCWFGNPTLCLPDAPRKFDMEHALLVLGGVGDSRVSMMLAADERVVMFLDVHTASPVELQHPVHLPTAALLGAINKGECELHELAWNTSRNAWLPVGEATYVAPVADRKTAPPPVPYNYTLPDSWAGIEWLPINVDQLAALAAAIAPDTSEAPDKGEDTGSCGHVLLGYLPASTTTPVARFVVLGSHGTGVLAAGAAGMVTRAWADEADEPKTDATQAERAAAMDSMVQKRMRQTVDRALLRLAEQGYVNTKGAVDDTARVQRRMAELVGVNRSVAEGMAAVVASPHEQPSPSATPSPHPEPAPQVTSWQGQGPAAAAYRGQPDTAPTPLTRWQ